MHPRTPTRRSRSRVALAARLGVLALLSAFPSVAAAYPRAVRSLGASHPHFARVARFPQQQQPPAPIERRPPPPASGLPATAPTEAAYNSQAGLNAGQRAAAPHPPRGEHLAEWMSQHSNLTPEQQQEALGHEPGFNTLPPETQQRMRNRLAQLDAMNPAKRERTLEHNEAMERLTPPQRAEVRSAMSQLGSLPPDQRLVVARTFRALRDLPADQRLPALNSGRFGPPLNEAQRAVMYNLLRVEPMLLPPLPRRNLQEQPSAPPAMQTP